MNSLIHPTNTWLLWAVILAGVGLSIWLEQTYRWAAKLSGPVLAMVLAMTLSNLKIMPSTTEFVLDQDGNKQALIDGDLQFVPAATTEDELKKRNGEFVKTNGVYEIIQGDLVPLALPLLLFRANVFHIVRTTGWLFLTFHFAAVGTIIGAIIATFALQTQVPLPNEIAGIMTASFIGGAVNFVAVANTYDTPGNYTGPLIVADNFIMAGMFILMLLIAGSKWARRWYPHPFTNDAVDSQKLAAEHWRRKEISLLDIAGSMAIAVAVVALSRATSGAVKQWLEGYRFAGIAGNLFVHITILSMVVATIGHGFLAKLRGSEEIGGYLLYLFLFAIGLPADLWQVFSSVPMMFVFCAIIALTNLAVVMLLGRLFRMNLEHILLSCNATLGGPPSAAAMAIAQGWSSQVLPALLVGIWGYAIGTAVGLGVGDMLKAMLSGS